MIEDCWAGRWYCPPVATRTLTEAVLVIFTRAGSVWEPQAQTYLPLLPDSLPNFRLGQTRPPLILGECLHPLFKSMSEYISDIWAIAKYYYGLRARIGSSDKKFETLSFSLLFMPRSSLLVTSFYTLIFGFWKLFHIGHNICLILSIQLLLSTHAMCKTGKWLNYRPSLYPNWECCIFASSLRWYNHRKCTKIINFQSGRYSTNADYIYSHILRDYLN